MQFDCERWITLSDRQSVGDELPERDRAWLMAHARACSSCGQEAEFYASLRDGLGRPEALVLPAQPLSLPARQPSRIRARSIGLALAASAALAIGASGYLGHRHDPPLAMPVAPTSAHVLYTSGETRLGSQVAEAGLTVGQGERFSTEEGVACVAIAQSITVCLDAQGSATLSLADPDHLVVYLEKGRLLAQLDHQPAGRKFVVRTKQTDVQAVGTRFLVSVNGKGKTLVRLHEGIVNVRTANNIASDLTAPAQADVAEDIRVASFPATAESEDRALLQLGALPRMGAGVPLHIQTDPPGAEVVLGDQALGKTPMTTFLLGDSRIHLNLPGFAPLTDWITSNGEGPVERLFAMDRLAPSPSVTPTSPATAIHKDSPRVLPSQLLAKAQTLRARGDYDGCASLYHRLWSRFPESGEAKVSMISLGELELAERKKPVDALAAFEGYLRVGGPLSREARYGKIRALRLLARNLEADNETAAFLRDYPVSSQAATLRRQPHGK